MAIKFTYDGNVGVTYQADHEDELTVEEVRAVAALNTAQALGHIADALSELEQAIRYKDFYDKDAARDAAIAREAKTKRKASTKKRRIR